LILFKSFNITKLNFFKPNNKLIIFL